MSNVDVYIGAKQQDASCKYKQVNIKPGIPFESQLNEDHALYILKWDYDLNGKDPITFPVGCILDFQGGSIINGTLKGSVELRNVSEDFYELNDCSNLYVINGEHLTNGDMQDVYDTESVDYTIRSQANVQIKSSRYYYCIDKMKMLTCSLPLKPISTLTYCPSIIYYFYDEDFKFIKRSGWFYNTSEKMRYTDIPENAVYVTFAFSYNGRKLDFQISDVYQWVSFNFLNKTKVYVENEYEKNKEILNISPNVIGRLMIYGDSTTKTYFAQASNASGTYEGKDYKVGSVFIPHCVFKKYYAIEVTPDYNRNAPIIYFLSKVPTRHKETVEICKDYKSSVTMSNDGKAHSYIIPSDCKCIFLRHTMLSGGVPKYYAASKIRLRTKESYNSNDFNISKTDHVILSNRNINNSELKFMMWNYGGNNIGGYMHAKRMEYMDQHYNLYEIRKAGFKSFFNKHKGEQILFCEDTNWYNGNYSINIADYISSKKGFFRTPSFGQFNQSLSYNGNLIGYKFGCFDCLKGAGKYGTKPFYSSYYMIYRYAISNSNLYIVHVHIPFGGGTLELLDGGNKQLYAYQLMWNELKKVTSSYPNVIITGDFNYNIGTKSAQLNVYSSFHPEDGWHIANLDFSEYKLDSNNNKIPLNNEDNYFKYVYQKNPVSTHDWKPQNKENTGGNHNAVFDLCIWRGNYINIKNFKVDTTACTSLYNKGGEGLWNESIDAQIYADGRPLMDTMKLNDTYVKGRLSDHWPICFTVETVNSQNSTSSDEGNIRYNFQDKDIECFNGDIWTNSFKAQLSLPYNDIDEITNEEICNLDLITIPGFYYCTDPDKVKNKPFDYSTSRNFDYDQVPVNVKAGFTLKYIRKVKKHHQDINQCRNILVMMMIN